MADDATQPSGDLKPAGTLAALGLYAVIAPPLGLAALLAASPVLEPLWGKLPPVAAFVAAVVLGVALVGSALLPSIGFAGYVGWVAHGGPAAYAIVLLSIAGATALGLAWARRLSATAARRLLRSHPAGARTLDAMERDSAGGLTTLVFMSRLSPHMPFALTNILVAQLRRPLAGLALVSFVGLLPRSVLAVTLGAGLRTAREWTSASATGAWAWLVTALVLLVAGRIVARAIRATPTA